MLQHSFDWGIRKRGWVVTQEAGLRRWLLGVSAVPVLSGEGGQMLLEHPHGQEVADNHDHEGEEEHHRGTHKHEARLSEDTTAIYQDLLLILQADHRDGQ